MEDLTRVAKGAASDLMQRAIIPLGAGETIDGIGRGEVLVIQRRGGYRFAVDAMLLASFAAPVRGRVCELGAGCGIVSLVLASRGAKAVDAVEVQPALYELAFRNISLNRLGQKIRIFHADLRALRGVLPARSYDLVVSNPPYVPLRAGVVNPVTERAVARHEVNCTPVDLAEASKFLLRDGGSVKVIFPAPRLIELTGALAAAGLHSRRIRMVHPIPGRPAKMVLVEATKNRPGALEVLPALYLFAQGGGPTAEAREILGDAGPSPERLDT